MTKLFDVRSTIRYEVTANYTNHKAKWWIVRYDDGDWGSNKTTLTGGTSKTCKLAMVEGSAALMSYLRYGFPKIVLNHRQNMRGKRYHV